MDSGFDSDDETKVPEILRCESCGSLQSVQSEKDFGFVDGNGQEIKDEILKGIENSMEFMPKKVRNLRILAPSPKTKRNLKVPSKFDASNSSKMKADVAAERYSALSLMR